jgi:DNA-binding transcriptional LysR family regulator
MRKPTFPALHGLDVRTLRLFESVVDAKNLTQAAKVNHLAVGAASRRISNFESLIGAPLLERHSRGLRLTPTGHLVAESVRNILDQLNGLGSISHNLRQGITDHVRLLANGVAITEYLPSIIMQFREKHPDVLVEIEESMSWNTANALLQQNASIGIVVSGVPTLGLRHFEYVTEALVLVTPRNHPLARRHRVRFTDTLDYDYIGLQPESLIYTMLREEARQAGKRVRILAQISGLYHVCSMVSAGLGLAVVPESLARSLQDAFKLATIKLEGRQFVFSETVLHIDEDKMTKTELALLEHLRNHRPIPAKPACNRASSTGPRAR